MRGLEPLLMRVKQEVKADGGVMAEMGQERNRLLAEKMQLLLD